MFYITSSSLSSNEVSNVGTVMVWVLVGIGADEKRSVLIVFCVYVFDGVGTDLKMVQF